MESWITVEEAAEKSAFRAANKTDLLLHEAAKRDFDAQGVKKLPKFYRLSIWNY